jgi:integrase
MARIRKRTWTNSKGEQTAWIADYLDQKGKRHIKTFARKKDADDWLTTARHEVKQGIHTAAAGSITVAEAGERWIAQAEADGLERSTIRQCRQHLSLSLHIKPYIGTVKLSALTLASVQNFRNRLCADGRSRAMVKRATTSLGGILTTAKAEGLVAQNVVRDMPRDRSVRVDRRHKRQLEVGVDIPSKGEIRALLAASRGLWRVLLVTAVFTGLRASELRGLRWEDVDLARAALTVRQRADRWNIIGSPKSGAGRRQVPLVPLVIKTLREWRVACSPGSELVFPNREGRPLDMSNLYRDRLDAVCAEAGVVGASGRHKYGLHALRHAAASLFIEQGFTAKRVQTVMGHSSIAVTFDIYGHLFPAPDEQTMLQQLQARLLS